MGRKLADVYPENTEGQPYAPEKSEFKKQLAAAARKNLEGDMSQLHDHMTEDDVEMSEATKKNVPEMLRESAGIYEERNLIYGDNYITFGGIMQGLFPRGLTINGIEDWSRMGILIQMASKLGRYAANFERGGHEDSLRDLAVYTTMLRELDQK